MEEECRCCCCCCCCCCGGEAGPHRHNTFIQPPRQKETRQTRMVQFLAVALLLLMSGALAVLGTVVLGGRGHQAPEGQLTTQPNDHSPVAHFEKQQQKDIKNPSAMLTAPIGNIGIGEFLQWESAVGKAFCQGGFSYSNGSLVVPKKGIYRVFLQITYESKEDLMCDPGEDKHRLLNKVFLIQDSYNTNVQLLSSVDSVNCSMNQWSKSLYTAGLFSLEANSRLRVTSSKPELIVRKEYQVFFGAELLPQ